MIGLYSRCCRRIVSFKALRSVCWKTSHAQKTRSQSSRPLAELLLCGETLGVGREVPLQMGPAELAALGGQMRVGPPAVRGHDCLRVGQEFPGVILVTVSGDVKEGVAIVKDTPQRAALAGGPPAGLIHVHRTSI